MNNTWGGFNINTKFRFISSIDRLLDRYIFIPNKITNKENRKINTLKREKQIDLLF